MMAGDENATNASSPVFLALRDGAGPEWRAYVDHPFVRGLGDGTLPRAAYLAYLRQDYLFLIHFARAWALLAFKSRDVEELRIAAGTVKALIDEEMRLHIETCASEGIGAEELAATTEAPQTIAYTRYVIDRGLAGDNIDLLVALAPCIFGYGEIGKRLAKTATSPAYRSWIDTYAGPDYEAVCDSVGGLLERLCARTIGPEPQRSPRWADLQSNFTMACRLEAAFWEAGRDDLLKAPAE